MHIPNGFLDSTTIAITTAASGGVMAYAVKKSKEALKHKYIPLIGVTAAFIFAAQMINFPIAAGTSGHFMGAAFAVIVAGPYGGCLIMALVVTLQCLLFQDGGLTALGANILNMAIIAPFSAYTVYRAINRINDSILTRNVAVFLAGFASVATASIALSIELSASGISKLATLLPPVLGIHLLIGLVEGVITVSALTVISRLKPEIIGPTNGKISALKPMAILAALTLLLTPLASSSPDGLERIAERFGFSSYAISSISLFSDYSLPILSGECSVVIAGLIGALAIALLSSGIFMLMKRSSS